MQTDSFHLNLPWISASMDSLNLHEKVKTYNRQSATTSNFEAQPRDIVITKGANRKAYGKR